jgi:hypothetical protein
MVRNWLRLALLVRFHWIPMAEQCFLCDCLYREFYIESQKFKISQQNGNTGSGFMILILTLKVSHSFWEETSIYK